MAKRRMFCIDITYDDKFLDMSYEAQLLYYHLGMQADDDGFFPSPVRVGRTMGLESPQKALAELAENGFIIPFASGVIAITHWNLNNQIRKDRRQDTYFKRERRMLVLEDYTYYLKEASVNQVSTKCQPDGESTETQLSTVQSSTGQDSLVQDSQKEPKKAPSQKECKDLIRAMFELRKQDFPKAPYKEAIRTIRGLIDQYGLSMEEIRRFSLEVAVSEPRVRPSQLFGSPHAFMVKYQEHLGNEGGEHGE